jgi:hypothetical protein
MWFRVNGTQLLFQGDDRLLEHPSMRRDARSQQVRASTRQCQLDRVATVERIAFARRQRAAGAALQTLRFSLLKLDVLAFESPSHRYLQLLSGQTGGEDARS